MRLSFGPGGKFMGLRHEQQQQKQSDVCVSNNTQSPSSPPSHLRQSDGGDVDPPQSAKQRNDDGEPKVLHTAADSHVSGTSDRRTSKIDTPEVTNDVAQEETSLADELANHQSYDMTKTKRRKKGVTKKETTKKETTKNTKRACPDKTAKPARVNKTPVSAAADTSLETHRNPFEDFMFSEARLPSCGVDTSQQGPTILQQRNTKLNKPGALLKPRKTVKTVAGLRESSNNKSNTPADDTTLAPKGDCKRAKGGIIVNTSTQDESKSTGILKIAPDTVCASEPSTVPSEQSLELADMPMIDTAREPESAEVSTAQPEDVADVPVIDTTLTSEPVEVSSEQSEAFADVPVVNEYEATANTARSSESAEVPSEQREDVAPDTARASEAVKVSSEKREDVDDVPVVNEYEALRLKTIRKNQEFLMSIGLAANTTSDIRKGKAIMANESKAKTSLPKTKKKHKSTATAGETAARQPRRSTRLRKSSGK
jgi:hypothetical protein